MAKKVVESQTPAANEETALVQQPPAPLTNETLPGFLEDAAEFGKDFSAGDFAVPFLQILQSNSPQQKEGDPKCIDGAKAGQFFNTVTKQFWPGVKDGLDVIPVQYEKCFIEWKIREKGGGFIKKYNVVDGVRLAAQCQQDEKNRLILPGTNGEHQLVETAQYFVLALPADAEPFPAMFTLTSTQLKKSRQWNNAIEGLKVTVGSKKVRPPMFYMAYNLKALYESNEKGSWYGVEIKPIQPVTELEGGEQLYLQARALRQMAEAGRVTTSDNDAEAAVAAEGNTPF